MRQIAGKCTQNRYKTITAYPLSLARWRVKGQGMVQALGVLGSDF
jgi:hypothetical protein